MVTDSTTTARLVADTETVADHFGAAVAEGWDVTRLSIEVQYEVVETEKCYRFYVKATLAESVSTGSISRQAYLRRVVDTFTPWTEV